MPEQYKPASAGASGLPDGEDIPPPIRPAYAGTGAYRNRMNPFAYADTIGRIDYFSGLLSQEDRMDAAMARKKLVTKPVWKYRNVHIDGLLKARKKKAGGLFYRNNSRKHAFPGAGEEE